MSILFVVEDGTSKDDSNSYVTTDYIDQYAENLGYSEWDTYSIVQKQNFAIEASQYIDLKFEFNGYMSDEEQAMQFPRSECYDYKRKKEYGTSDIPEDLKKAVADLACNKSISERLLSVSTSQEKRIEVDVIKIENFSQTSATTKGYPAVKNLLKGFASYIGGNSINLERC